MNHKPMIAIPIGDPAGIGPEIVVKALNDEKVKECTRCVVVGDRNVIENALHITGVHANIRLIEQPEQGVFEDNTINLVDLHNIDMNKLKIGTVCGMCGKAAYLRTKERLAQLLQHRSTKNL